VGPGPGTSSLSPKPSTAILKLGGIEIEGEQIMHMGESSRQYPAAMVNITNRCTLRCKHCFVYRDGNPNDKGAEMDSPTMLGKLSDLQRLHGIQLMLWMGGEPLLRPDVLWEGAKLFSRNTVTTNGTLDLIELPNCTYVISVDGPPGLNDAIRGKGTFKKVMNTLSRVPEPFGPTVTCQCVVTRQNEDSIEELVEQLMPTRAEGMTFSFYVPPRNDDSDLTWGSLGRRDKAVREVMRLQQTYPDFIRNKRRSLEMMLSENSKLFTDNCLAKRFVMPLYLEGSEFVTPYCCYGNDVDCDLCGAWVVFHIAAKVEEGDFLGITPNATQTAPP
jgi:MoaA/NifB/PqqE/SkfB family radical SAM enzyme